MARKLWAGLDIGVETTSVCVIDEAGEVLHEAVCPTNVKSVHHEIRFLKRRRCARIGLESGTGFGVARGLRTLGYTVDIYEARQLSKFLRARRNKTDAGDANGIAQAGRIAADLVSKVHLKSLECQSLAARLKIRRHLIVARASAVNLLCRQLEQFGGRIKVGARSPTLRPIAEAKYCELFGKAPNPLASDMRHLLDHCMDLVAHEKEVDRDFERLARENDLCRRLMEIPGVGPICALTFYAAVGEPLRFRRSSESGPISASPPGSINPA